MASLKGKATAKEIVYMPLDLNQLDKAPTDPGVYLMKNNKGVILYVGKAKNLKQRVKQYFVPGRDGRAMVPFLTAQVEVIETIVTFSEKDALLLENSLIKQHRPKYNVLLKDDKTFVSVLINHRHHYPMVKIVRYRDAPKEKGLLFGPYTSAFAARQTVDLMSRIFKLRQCSDRELRARSRPCLLYSIGRCLAPCVGKCTPLAYREEVERAIAFLKGSDTTIVDNLKKEMECAAEQLEFERAQLLLETIRQVEHVTREKQVVVNVSATACDAFALHREDERSLIVKLPFRHKQLTGVESYFLDNAIGSDEEIWESFLLQHYTYPWMLPTEILLPSSLPNKEALEDILSHQRKSSVSLVFPKKGNKKHYLALAQKNAHALFHQHREEKQKNEHRLLALQEVCHLTHYPLKIECFDVSNISGSDPVACMVGFYKGARDKKMTRLFHIKTASGGDDYGALREALSRHYTKAKETQSLPDLIVIDGGKGHLNVAQAVLKELEIASLDVIALTKEEGKHDKGLRNERIFLPHCRDPLVLPVRSPPLFLLQHIRDEAHRTAIAFQRKKRSKRTLQSALDTIPGIGPKKRALLLEHFHSPKKAAAAPRQELKQLAKLSDRDIDNLYERFRSS